MGKPSLAPTTQPPELAHSCLWRPLARHMQNGVRILASLGQRIDALRRRNLEEFDVTRPSLTLDLLHDWQSAVGSGTNYQPPAAPRKVLCHGQRRVALGVAEAFGGLFLSLANAPAFDDHVILVCHTIDLNGTECERAEVHEILP